MGLKVSEIQPEIEYKVRPRLSSASPCLLCSPPPSPLGPCGLRRALEPLTGISNLSYLRIIKKGDSNVTATHSINLRLELE